MSRVTTNDPWMAAYDALAGGAAQTDPWMAEYDKLAGGVQPDLATNAARMTEAMAQPATGTAIPTYTQNPNNPLSRPVPGGQVGQFATGAASELMGLPATGARAAQAGVQFLANRAPAGSQWGTLAQDAARGIGGYASGLEAVTDVAASGVGLPQTTGGVAETLGRGAAQLGFSVASGSGPASVLGRAGTFAATSAAPVVGNTMRDATAETGNAGKAADEAVLNGVITGATSVIPGLAILNRVPGGGQLVKAAAQRAVTRLAGAGIAEGSQEYAEGVLDELTAELIRRDKSLTPSMVWRAMTNPDRAMDVLGGAVLGSAARGGVEVAGRIGGANGVQDAHAVPSTPNAAPDQGAGVAPAPVAPPGAVGPVATDVPGPGGVEPEAAEVGASTFDQVLAELRAAEGDQPPIDTRTSIQSKESGSLRPTPQENPQENVRTPDSQRVVESTPLDATSIPPVSESAVLAANESSPNSTPPVVKESLTTEPVTLTGWKAEARRLGVSEKGSMKQVRGRVRAQRSAESPRSDTPALPVSLGASVRIPQSTGPLSVMGTGSTTQVAPESAQAPQMATPAAGMGLQTATEMRVPSPTVAPAGREAFQPYQVMKTRHGYTVAHKNGESIPAYSYETEAAAQAEADRQNQQWSARMSPTLAAKVSGASTPTAKTGQYFGDRQKSDTTTATPRPASPGVVGGSTSGEGSTDPEAPTVTDARYAKGQKAVSTPSKDGWKSRAGRLAEALGGRWVNREKAYIMSPTKAAKFEKLYADGWDANSVSKELEPPKAQPEFRLVSRLDQYPDTQAAKDKANATPKGSNPRRRGAALNPIEEIADRLRTAQRQGRKSAAGPSRDVAKIEKRAARNADRALRRAESSAAKLSEQLGESQDVKRAYRDVLRESRRDLAVAREDIVKLGDKLRAAKDKAAVAEEARTIVGRVANALPRHLRGTLVTDIRDAKGVADVYVAVQKARDAVAKEIGRDAKKVLDRYTSRKVKGRLSDAAREKLADIERRAAEAGRQFNAPIASAGDAAIELADLADQAKAVVHEHRLENKLIREGRFWDAELDRQKVVENLAAKKPLPLKADGKGREQPGIIANLFRGNMNAHSIAATLDGFTKGPVTQLMREIQDGQSRRFELTEAATAQADAAANRAGFDNLSHLMAATSDLLGEGPTIRKDVTLGGRKFTLTLGELAKLYSTEQDVNTRALIAAGKPIQFRTGGKFSDPIRLTPADFATVAEAFPQEIKAAVDSMKATRDRMFPAVQKVIRTLKGYEPPKEQGYEPRYVNREQSGATTDAELTPDLSGQIEKHLENAGFTIERVKDKTNPLIIGDFFHDWSRSVNGQADVIALAVPIANARKVLLATATKQAIADRYGDVATKRLREILVDAAGLRADPGSVTAAVQRLTRNVSYARTALRPTSWLIQGAGVPRVAAEMPASAFAAGLRGAFSPSLGRRMMEGSPMLRKRYSGTLASVNTSLGDPSTAIAPHGGETIREAVGTAARAGKAVVTDAAKGDIGGVVNKALPELFDTIRISNFFDSIPARIAWAGFEAEARRTGKDQAWVRQQAENALSRVLNSSDPLHLTAYGSKFRNTPLVPFTAFTSDAAAAWNQVYQGWGESRTKGMKATAAVVAGSLWAAAITGASGYLGKVYLEEKDEEDARKEALRQAATRFLQETVGMGFVEGKLADLIDASAKGFDVNVADAPMIGAVNQTIRATHGLSTAIYDRLASEDPAKVETASRRFVDALARIAENAGALAGNPLTPAVGATRKAVKSEMEEAGKELREKKRDATGDDGTSPEEALGRRQLYEAMSTGGDTAKAFATLRKAGVRLSRKQIQSLVEAKHPARGMKPIERIRYLRSLSPDARAEYDRQVERYKAAVKAIPRTVRASRAGSSAPPR